MSHSTTILCHCPTCEAQPGDPCQTKGGNEASVCHVARRDRAREIESRPKRAEFMDYPCSHCGAKPKEECRGPNGKRAEAHDSRRKQAFKAWKPGDIEHRSAFEHSDDGGRRDETGSIVPALPDTWRALFLKSTLRTGFCLVLTQPMLEQLCAIADQVHWDRTVFRHSLGLAQPDNPVTRGALERRGLVRHRGTRVLRDQERGRSASQRHERWNDDICDVWELTPAGEQLVELLRTTGVFLEQTAATTLQARRA